MRCVLLLLVGCVASPPPQPPPPVAAPPPPVRVDFEVSGEHGGDGEAICHERAQPPEVKLALGHYRSHRRGIGLVIDRTADDHAKIRFDHDDRVQRLVPRYHWFRTEYHRDDVKLLELHNDGRAIAFVGGQEIWLYRDCDADPL